MKRFSFLLLSLFFTFASQAQVLIIGGSDGKKEVTDSTGKKRDNKRNEKRFISFMIINDQYIYNNVTWGNGLFPT